MESPFQVEYTFSEKVVATIQNLYAEREGNSTENWLIFTLNDLKASKHILSHLFFSPWEIPNLLIADVLMKHGITPQTGQNRYEISEEALHEIRNHNFLLTVLYEPTLLAFSGGVFAFNVLNMTFRPDIPTSIRLIASGVILTGCMVRMAAQVIVKTGHTNFRTPATRIVKQAQTTAPSKHPARIIEINHQGDEKTSSPEEILNKNPKLREFLYILSWYSPFDFTQEFKDTGKTVIQISDITFDISIGQLPPDIQTRIYGEFSVSISITSEIMSHTHKFFLTPNGEIVGNENEVFSKESPHFVLLYSLFHFELPALSKSTKTDDAYRELRGWFDSLIWR